MTHALRKKIILSGTLTARTGLMIGASQNGMTIGGTNREVIRNPVSGEPYIPGSSLKGKMRSLFELAEDELGPNIGSTEPKEIQAGPSTSPAHKSARLFGYIPKDDNEKSGKLDDQNRPYQRPSRLIVRDAHLSNAADLQKTTLLYTEVKTENAINRITAQATPRNFERVPAGATFAFELVLNVFEGDDEAELLACTRQALRLLQDDYLGGGGSRGNGQVSFKFEKMVERTVAFYRGQEDEKACNLTDFAF